MSSGTPGRVAKRGSSWYYVVDGPPVDGKRRQLYKGGYATKKAAQTALGDVIGKVMGGDFIEPTKITFKEYAEQVWLPARAPLDGDDSRLRPSTYASYKSQLETHVYPRIGGVALQRVTAIDLDRLYTAMQTGADGRRKLSPRSVRYVHAIVRATLGHAVDKDLLARNVADKASPPEPSKRGPHVVWSIDELRRFLAHVRERRLYAMWHLFAVTAARRGEIVGLRWSDVDLDAATLTISRALVQAVTSWCGGSPRATTALAPSASTLRRSACCASIASGRPRSGC